jgi:hypothetical protein
METLVHAHDYTLSSEPLIVSLFYRSSALSPFVRNVLIFPTILVPEYALTNRNDGKTDDTRQQENCSYTSEN